MEESKQSIAYFLQNPKCNAWINQIIETSDKIDELLQQFKTGRCIGVSDGSFIRCLKLGAAAWIICTSNGRQWFRGGGGIFGLPEDQSAYRSELGGLLELTMCTMALTKCTGITPNITFACEGKFVLGLCVSFKGTN